MPRLIRVFAPATLLIAAIFATWIGMVVGGAGEPQAILDPGAVVRYGAPLARMLVNISGGVLFGALLLAVWALKGEGKENRAVLDLAAGSAAVMTVAAIMTAVFVFLDASNLPFSFDQTFGAGLAQFLTEIELGQLWLWIISFGAVTTVITFAVSDRRWLILAVLLATATLVPLAQQGHAQGAPGQAQAVNSLFIHLTSAAAWIGGLITVIMLSRVVDRARISVIVARYSSIALFAYIGIAASGVVSAWLRIGTIADLFGTGYGKLVLLKTGAIILLGVYGALQRQWFLPRIADTARGAKMFGWFVVSELLVMGVASGLAAALGRTRTPVPIQAAQDSGEKITPAEWLTGDPLPPEFTIETFFSEWKFDLLWVLVSAFGIAVYLAGVNKLAKRGDKWPIGRTIAWVLGLTLLFFTTNGSLNAYERYVFSIHMLGHMMLTMLIPLILVLGAPVTLLLRATEKRSDGSWGGREWVMWAIQTPYSKFITHPIVAAVVFAGSLWVFYFTPMLSWAMREHLGHQWMIIHFLISGYLFSLTVIGIDPIPLRLSYPLRIVTLFATMAAHAFFGVTIMSMTGMLAPEWFGAMGRTWGLPPLEDQSAGGSIAWGIGELPTLALAIIVTVQWMLNDDKVQKRRDRAADRSGESELKAYNEMLAKQAVRDEKLKR
ncbi:MAG TPA: cytochrome c oxidase assembly protein [Microbacteriaceae bacterium]|nr:cytochrome c oxidase assembly protein [Microbacteriaceae bacterium]